MHRPVLVAALLLATAACSHGARPGETPTARRVPVELHIERTTIAASDTVLPFTLRLTNAGTAPARLDFTGDPLFPRGPRDKVPVPALWLTLERYDRVGSTGSSSRPFAPRDTVLAGGETMQVPVEHSLREMGVTPGTYRMRAGIGSHASGWVVFTVTP
jgi:hypothetical protein